MSDRMVFKKHIEIDTRPLYYAIGANGWILREVDISDRTYNLLHFGSHVERIIEDVSNAAQEYVDEQCQFKEDIENYKLEVTLHSSVGYSMNRQEYNWEVFFRLKHKDLIDDYQTED